jgi:ATP-dependent protease ClpP protease subunit
MYKNFLHIKNVSEDGKTATMLLNKRIGNAYDDMGNCTEYGIQGDIFSNEMLYLRAVENVQNIEVEINSIGGDVTNDGYNIVSAIIKHKANTIVTGLAASMAGICAIAGDKRRIMDYGSIMCHPVSGGGGDDKVKSIIEDSLKGLFMGRSRMNADTVSNIFSKETWFSNSKKADFNLQKAIEMGIVDEIVSTGKNLKALNTATRSVAALSNIYNSLNTKNMIKVTAALKLTNEASEDAIVGAIEAIKIENTNAVKAFNDLKIEHESDKVKLADALKKVTDIENAAEAEKTKTATEAVEAALKAGKFKSEEKADMLVLAKTNLTAFNKLVGAAANIKEAVKIPFGGGVENAAEDRSTWDAVTWSKKDPEGLREKIKENPDFYNTLPKPKSKK